MGRCVQKKDIPQPGRNSGRCGPMDGGVQYGADTLEEVLLGKTPYLTFLDSKKLADEKMLDKLSPINNVVREVSTVR